MEASIIDVNYASLIESIVELHQRAQADAAGAVNRFLLLRNWLIEAYVIEFELIARQSEATRSTRAGQRRVSIPVARGIVPIAVRN